ncbi:MAG: Dam family site-specific DNA-(adenine-N6)-methyltransferase [Candidatus Dadabacteria bacterium]|nr:Dam family site-specific DNA-(adenine-N6)-methyltransferase [Candidatus Dadabacteria bacterium]
MKKERLEPLLKWPGGKRWLAQSVSLLLPKKYRSYYEPFLGSGAVFFYLQPNSGLISDKNAELINLYEIVRDYPHKIRKKIEKHQLLHSKEHYYKVRSMEPKCMIERAVRFLYLNRTCWNGLYRVNRKGHFNVPVGTKQKVVFDYDDFVTMSKRLKNIGLRCSDFEDVIDEAKENDFIFVDPPYTVKHNFNGFIQYNEKIFSWQDQERLHGALERAANRGCFIIVTNADCESVRDLYKNANYRQVSRKSVIAGVGHKRGIVTEAIFTFNL